MGLIKLKNFITEQESAQQKGKDLQVKTTAEKEMLDIYLNEIHDDED